MQDVPEHEMIFSEFGVQVAMQFKRDGPFKGTAQRFRNITEIHYNYPQFPVGAIEVRGIFPAEKEARTVVVAERKTPSGKIAFESDVHQTGVTYCIEELESFTILKKESKPACPFCEVVPSLPSSRNEAKGRNRHEPKSH